MTAKLPINKQSGFGPKKLQVMKEEIRILENFLNMVENLEYELHLENLHSYENFFEYAILTDYAFLVNKELRQRFKKFVYIVYRCNDTLESLGMDLIQKLIDIREDYYFTK
jgi:hypothetical protein